MSFDATYPFNVPFLPPKIVVTAKMQTLLLEAGRELAELKGYSVALPNPMLLLSPAILKEAVDSSEIENINTTIERVLQQQLFPDLEQKTETKEVSRYREAIIHGFNEIMKKMPISNRLILSTHKKLLGERSYGYRRNQNHIENSETRKIVYTPPLCQKIPELIANWENYIHDTSTEIDPLIKCAVSHYQFEAIHPFNDGNGRTGRILMVLYLIQQGLLHYPILYISGFVARNRPQYYQLLQNVSIKADWEPYILYMLTAFKQQAIETKSQLFKVMGTFHKAKDEIKSKCPKVYSSDLIELLFSYPVITPVKLGKLIGVHYVTATKYLKELNKNGFLEHKKVGKYQLYINTSLLKILDGE